MTSHISIAQAGKHLWHPYTRWSSVRDGKLPMITRGEGPYLFDDEGHKYLDAISSWWACALGHGHPAVVAAIQRQATDLQHSILGNLSHPGAAQLSSRLARLMPDSERHVHFASDGASAVEAALKIAIQYWHNTGRPGRTRFVSLRQAYHGDTLATLSLGFLKGFHEPFRSIRLPSLQVPVPPYDATEHEALKRAEELLEQHGGEVAAVIVEPLCQGAAGMRIYSPEYLGRLHALSRTYDVLFIVDEIATGFGRTGRMFAFEHAGIDPDIVCMGKALSAGYQPISAAVVRNEVFDTFTDSPQDHTFYHGHTFAGNPIASAAALAALDVYEQLQLPEKARKAGLRVAEVLSDLTTLPHVRDVRTLGLIAAVELADEAGGSATPHRPQRIQQELRDQGILVRPLGQVLYLMPPLIMDDEELLALAHVFATAVANAG